jgi:hypothetical protein
LLVGKIDANWFQQEESKGGQIQRKELNGYEPLGDLPWTHNTSAKGLLGILSLGEFLAGTERVNFRYDLDSRYNEGVSIILKPQLEWCWKGTVVQDLYDQALTLHGYNFGGHDPKQQTVEVDPKNPSLEVVRTHLNYLTEVSDFRDTQVARYGEEGKLKERDKQNYNLSLVNPQLRIPKEKNIIGISHIEFVIMTQTAHDTLQGLLKQRSLPPSMTEFFRRNNVAVPTLANGRKNYNNFVENGRIKVIRGGGFSHSAGRLNERSLKDQESMKAAAALGLEHEVPYFAALENNSPSALDMPTMVAFQRVYYGVLAVCEGHRAQRRAIAILDSRKKAEASPRPPSPSPRAAGEGHPDKGGGAQGSSPSANVG